MVLSRHAHHLVNGEDSAILTIFALSVPLMAEMQIMLFFFLFSDKSCRLVVALQWIRLLVELWQGLVVEGALAHEQGGFCPGGKPILVKVASEV